jgi:hypothetical protein
MTGNPMKRLLILLLFAGAAMAQSVAPILDCVTFNEAANTVTATWGYVNASSTAVTIPPGNGNTLTPIPGYQGQPTTFQRGEFHDVFQTKFNLGTKSTQTWTAGRTPVSATNDPNNYCSSAAGTPGTPGPDGPPGRRA